MSADGTPGRRTGRRRTDARAAALTLGALGVVFGDIGTSPLYALEAAFSAPDRPVLPVRDDVFGLVSMVVWTLTMVVSIKYVTLIMRANNDGEGGILALIALVQRASARARAGAALVVLGLVGAALFYGDGMITPAVSVLSAVEGLEVASPGISNLIVPISVGLLVALFAVQRFGTGLVGRFFGPVMVVWFAAIAVWGVRQIVLHPDILQALSPTYAVQFFVDQPLRAFVALASVALTITGAEALYADMGHFGRSPIRRAWFALVFPALALNYLGQGALIIHSPKTADNPFYLMVPEWAQMGMVILATAATVIASQAVISGTFSLTHQAVQLGFLPRMTVKHTSEQEAGQVYVPVVNWLVCAAVAALVVGFESSNRLAAAYGVAVTGTMAITTVLFFFVARQLWRTSLPLVIGGAIVFLTIDLALFSTSLAKVFHGGWVPLLVGLIAFTVLTTWRTGWKRVIRKVEQEEGALRDFVHEVRDLRPPVLHAPGTGVFITLDSEKTPLALRDNVERNHVLHSRVVIVVVEGLKVPHVALDERVTVDALGYRDEGIALVKARFGYHDPRDLPLTLELAAEHGLGAGVDLDRASYYLARFVVVPTASPGMARWRKHLFVALWRNSMDPMSYYRVPDERTITMGSLIEL
jgi:KUP system potassium uptake protein